MGERMGAPIEERAPRAMNSSHGATSQHDSGSGRKRSAPPSLGRIQLPLFLAPEEVAALLRTTRKAIYAMAERGALPGVTKIGRRVLVRQDKLLDWLDRKCSAPSPKENRR